LGIVSTGATVFLAAGPVLGGLLTQFFGWRSVFAINLLPILVVLVVAARWMPESRVQRREAIDLRGLVLLVCGLAAMTTALLQVQTWGWVATVVTAVVAVVALAGFVVVERRSSSPLVDLRLLRIPAVAGSLTGLLAFQFAILGLTVYFTLYLQHVLGFAPAVAGALSLPAVALAPFLAGRVGRATDSRGMRGLTVGALVLASAAVLAIGLLSGERVVLLLLVPLLAFGVARPVATIAGTAGAVGAISAQSRDWQPRSRPSPGRSARSSGSPRWAWSSPPPSTAPAPSCFTPWTSASTGLTTGRSTPCWPVVTTPTRSWLP